MLDDVKEFAVNAVTYTAGVTCWFGGFMLILWALSSCGVLGDGRSEVQYDSYSEDSYVGNCEYYYDRAADGSLCGKRSAEYR